MIKERQRDSSLLPIFSSVPERLLKAARTSPLFSSEALRFRAVSSAERLSVVVASRAGPARRWILAALGEGDLPDGLKEEGSLYGYLESTHIEVVDCLRLPGSQLRNTDALHQRNRGRQAGAQPAELILFHRF